MTVAPVGTWRAYHSLVVRTPLLVTVFNPGKRWRLALRNIEQNGPRIVRVAALVRELTVAAAGLHAGRYVPANCHVDDR